MKKPTTKKRRSRGGKSIGRWVRKGRKSVQSGGFLSLIIGGLVALGVAAETAASVAAVAAPVISGAVSGAAAYGTTKALGGSCRRRPQRCLTTRRRYRPNRR